MEGGGKHKYPFINSQATFSSEISTSLRTDKHYVDATPEDNATTPGLMAVTPGVISNWCLFVRKVVPVSKDRDAYLIPKRRVSRKV